ncbi:MAG: hypothetical protein HOA17_06855, partial [Candidatus Melainabacteria bacterium]|nr:hypothetical protein [Candidatus Melainabacteria bacterium]
MAAINSTQQLAKIRSQIDVQQQIVSQLEMELQFAILGAPANSAEKTLGDIVDDIQGLYGSVNGGSALGSAFETGVKIYAEDKTGTPVDLDREPEQDSIRHMLYQARAILGDLRIQEQQWNEEVKE